MNKYPATITVHWPTGPVHCCNEHARQLMILNEIFGGYVAQTQAPEDAECSNCKNESNED